MNLRSASLSRESVVRCGRLAIRPSYHLGPYVLDRIGYRLLQGSRALDLTPKLLDVLFCLADRAGALVTKEELLDTVWPGANVADNALAQAVSELRGVLGDDPAAPRFIRTIARRGYRLIAPVHVLSVPADAPVRPDAGGASGARTIAVMDFANTTGDPDLAWLANGVAETVTSDLRRLVGFRVIDRGRVLDAVEAAGGVTRRAADLVGSDLVVLGSYQRNGPRIRITAQLVNIVSGDAVGDAKVDGALDDVFGMQDEVGRRLAAGLGESDPAPPPGAAGRDTSSLDAYRAFTEGWLRLESLDLREMPFAVADLERAVAADPRYALAHAPRAAT